MPPRRNLDQSMRMRGAEVPDSAPSPEDSLSMDVTNLSFFAERHQDFNIQFQPPCLLRWEIPPFKVKLLGSCPEGSWSLLCRFLLLVCTVP